MYPIGIRVIKVSGTRNIGVTGTVTHPSKRRAVGCDMSVAVDVPVTDTLSRYLPAGTVCSAVASQWRPINPDADEETVIESKELEDAH